VVKTKIKEIVLEHLVDNNLDGLFSIQAECSCFIHNLFPCGMSFKDCQTGIRELCDCSDGNNFHIVAKEKEKGGIDDQESERV